MPNPGKSEETKKKLGSRSPAKPTVEQRVVLNAPEPLRRLEESGLQLWNQVWSQKQTWLKETDIELLQLVCEQMDERDVLRVFVLDNVEAWHERAALRLLEKQIKENLVELGFTPTARQKLGIQEVKAMSKLDALMARKEQRVASTMVDPSSD